MCDLSLESARDQQHCVILQSTIINIASMEYSSDVQNGRNLLQLRIIENL